MTSRTSPSPGPHSLGPTLTWRDKSTPTFSDPKDSVNERLIERHGDPAEHSNAVFRADCMEASPVLLRAFEGQVKLMYLDPPYFVGQDFMSNRRGIASYAYSDRWESLEHYLQFLYERLVLAHRLLTDDGSIYLHLDQRCSHWARCMLQEVFGPNNERGSIVWVLGNGAKSKSSWSCVHNDILCFSKSSQFVFRHERPALREPYASTSLKTHFRKRDEMGKAFRERTVNGRTYRYQAEEGRLIGSVWADCPAMVSRSPILHEFTGYPTQKPERLLERIIEASSDPGDLVADLCCGSGTAPAVAQRLERRFLACDIGSLAVETTVSRLLTQRSSSALCVFDVSAANPQQCLRLARLFDPSASWLEQHGWAEASGSWGRVIVMSDTADGSRDDLLARCIALAVDASATILVPANVFETVDLPPTAAHRVLAWLPEFAHAGSVVSLRFGGKPKVALAADRSRLEYARPMHLFDPSTRSFRLSHEESVISRVTLDAAVSPSKPTSTHTWTGDMAASAPLEALREVEDPVLTIVDASGYRWRGRLSST